MTSSTPVWEETLVFAESYRRLLAPETLVLFELVDFAAALSCKEARKVDQCNRDRRKSGSSVPGCFGSHKGAAVVRFASVW